MSDRSQISAGAGKACIGYPENFFPYNGFNHRYLTGVHDDLFVRAVMITNEETGILIISVDTSDLSGQWLPEISDISGIPEENIYLTATHTHEAPYIDRTIPEKVMDADKTAPFINEFRKALKTAILEAKASLAPARIGFGTGFCAANVNRDIKLPSGAYKTGVNPIGPTDHTVSVLKIEALNGRLIALINNYAVHSSIMLFSQVRDGGMLVSADLAGAAMNYVEKETGAVSLFIMGAAGDQNPLFSACKMTMNPDGTRTRVDEGEAGFALVRGLGNLLGAEIVRVNGTIKDMKDTASLNSVSETISVPGQKKAETRPGVPLLPDFEFEDDEPRKLRLGLASINDIAFAAVAGEIMNSIGADIKAALLGKGFTNAMIFTQCNGSNSYMGDDEAYDEKKFAATASFMKKGIAGIITNEIANLAEK